MDSVDNVHGLSGHCPWTQWTLSIDPRSNIPAGQCPLSLWASYGRVCISDKPGSLDVSYKQLA